MIFNTQTSSSTHTFMHTLHTSPALHMSPAHFRWNCSGILLYYLANCRMVTLQKYTRWVVLKRTPESNMRSLYCKLGSRVICHVRIAQSQDGVLHLADNWSCSWTRQIWIVVSLKTKFKRHLPEEFHGYSWVFRARQCSRKGARRAEERRKKKKEEEEESEDDESRFSPFSGSPL